MGPAIGPVIGGTFAPAEGKLARYVRVQGTDTIFEVKDTDISRILKAFGRSE